MARKIKKYYALKETKLSLRELIKRLVSVYHHPTSLGGIIVQRRDEPNYRSLPYDKAYICTLEVTYSNKVWKIMGAQKINDDKMLIIISGPDVNNDNFINNAKETIERLQKCSCVEVDKEHFSALWNQL